MTEKNFRIVDEDKLDELHDRILSLFIESDTTVYEALGILEIIKDDLLYEDNVE